MADTTASMALPQRPIIPAKKTHMKRKSDQNAQTSEHRKNESGEDTTGDDWWAEIIHQHHTLLTSHSRILSAILKSSPPASARHDTISKYLADTRNMLEHVSGVGTGVKRQRSDRIGGLGEATGKRRRDEGETEAELLSPSPSEEDGKATPKSVSVPQSKKSKRPKRPQSTSPRGEKVEVEDIRAEVEERLRAKERARSKLKDGSKKRRRRSSTIEAEERRREKRVKRESGGERKRASPEVEGKDERKKRKVT